MPKHISEETKLNIVNTYINDKISITELSARFGVCQPVVSKILVQHNVKLWSKAVLFSPDLQEDYFEAINSSTKAYLLGFITADGCIFWKNATQAFMAIELGAADKYILDLLKSEFRSNRRLVYSRRSNTYTFSCHSVKLVRDLAKYCIEPRSSLTQRFPKNIPVEFMCDYLRGVFDADGSYAFYARPSRSVHKKAVRMCSGSLRFLVDYVYALHDHTSITYPSVYEDKECCCWAINWERNDDIEKIINFFYSSNGPYLKRKKEIADKIIGEVRQYRDNRQKAAS